jgi:hypothetical protein
MSTKERPADGVCVAVPDESSIITVASGEPFLVEIENGRRVVHLPRDDARALLNSGTPESVAWRALNAELSAWLMPMSKPEAGINVAALQMARHHATRPLSIVEECRRLKAANMAWWRR